MKIALIVVGALVVLIGAVFLIGLALPRSHRATSSVTLGKPPADVWAVIRDLSALQGTWKDLKSARRLPDAGGREVWEQNAGGFPLRLVVEESSPPSRLVDRCCGRCGFRGTWTYQLEPAGSGTRLRLEDGYLESAQDDAPWVHRPPTFRARRRRWAKTGADSPEVALLAPPRGSVHVLRMLTLCLLSLLALAGCRRDTTSPVTNQSGVGLSEVASGLAFPLFLTYPPGDNARLFVVEKTGRIRIVKNALSRPPSSTSSKVSSGSEQDRPGFHPGYASNGRLSSTTPTPAVTLRYSRSRRTGCRRRGQQQIVLTIDQPYSITTAAWSPSGRMASLHRDGDGGSGGDPRAMAEPLCPARQDPPLRAERHGPALGAER
jgi:hypothetical protein